MMRVLVRSSSMYVRDLGLEVGSRRSEVGAKGVPSGKSEVRGKK
jgi:hypothetical protein